MRIELAALFLVLPGASAGAPIEELPADAAEPRCAIEIEFQSRHGDIDRTTLDRVTRYVDRSTIVTRAYGIRRATEEFARLCIVIEDQRRAIAVFEDLTRIVPARARKLPRLKPPPPVVLRYNGK